MEKETTDRFMEIAMRYIKAYDKVDNTPEFNEALKKEREGKIYSYTTMHIENEKLKLRHAFTQVMDWKPISWDFKANGDCMAQNLQSPCYLL